MVYGVHGALQHIICRSIIAQSENLAKCGNTARQADDTFFSNWEADLTQSFLFTFHARNVFIRKIFYLYNTTFVRDAA